RRVGPGDGVPEPLAPRRPGADGDLPARQLHASQWLRSEGPVPARGLVVPGPHEGQALDDHDPHAGVAVLGPGPDAEDLGPGQLLEFRPRESPCGSHFLKQGRSSGDGSNAAEPPRSAAAVAVSESGPSTTGIAAAVRWGVWLGECRDLDCPSAESIRLV